MSFSHLIPLLVNFLHFIQKGGKKGRSHVHVVKPIFEMENGFPICLCPLLSNGFLEFLSFDHSCFFFFFFEHDRLEMPPHKNGHH